MKALNTTIAAGEQVAKFSNGLAVKFNKPASQPYVVIVKAMADELSELEFRVVRRWCREWANQSTEGLTDDDCYDRFKYVFLWPCIREDYPEKVETFNAVKAAFQDFDTRLRILAPHLSHAEANHDQFHAALMKMREKLTMEPYNYVLTEPNKYHAARERAIKTGKIQTVGKKS